MSDDTLSNKQMDAAVDAAEADTQRALEQMLSQAQWMLKVSVIQDRATVYESVYSIKKVGDVEAAVSDAVGNARRTGLLRPWGWTISTSNS